MPCWIAARIFPIAINAPFDFRLMLQGYRQTIQESDVYELNKYETTHTVSARLKQNLTDQSKRCKTDKILSILTWEAFNLKQEGEKDSLLKPSDKRYHSTYSVNVVDRHKTFFTIIMTTFGWEFIYCNFGILLCALAYLCIPFLLGLLIDFIKDPDEPTWHGYIYLLAFVFIRIVNTVFRQSTEFLCVKLAIRVRSAIISALFQKALNLSSESQRKINEGEFLNLMFLDTNHVDMFLRNAYWLWMSVPMLLVSILLLSQIIGLSIIS
ncbi:multidrug resistance-associated protein 1, partial [Biomphalaria glabrata]